jgi:hypothetical protein
MLQEMEGFRNGISRPPSFWNSRFGQSFYVLTYCRMLHTLHTGTVQSKKSGREWVQKVVASQWIDLIDQAREERQGVRFGVKIGQRADLALLHKTLDFIEYIILQSFRAEV